MDLNELVAKPQYSIANDEKSAAMLEILDRLHEWHIERSVEYRHFNDVVFGGKNKFESIAALPFLPVSAFKNHTLRSASEKDVFKVLSSSGTTGQQVSRIFLD